MSTRCARQLHARPFDDVAAVACERRELLLRVHRFRLRDDDLEDCYSQAVLELLAHSKRGAVFANRAHIARALELRFLSRVRDRRRALSGRSPIEAALERATPLDRHVDSGADCDDGRACVERVVLAREELRELERLARELSHDQRLALAADLAGVPRSALCSSTGWSHEKCRKVGQRARLRLRDLREASDACPERARSVGRERRSTYGDTYPHIS